MNAAETWTVGKLLTWTTGFLQKSGSGSPRLDAEVLLAHARGCQRIELYTAFEEETTDQQRSAFREMVKRRSEGTPVAYLVGYKEFYSDKFEVNPDVLIPRPETEHLVVEALDRAAELESEGLRIVDVGTGSGVIAIELAKHLPTAEVTAIDQSEAALEVARRNAQQHQLGGERVAMHCGDLLGGLEGGAPFDLIVSNPPYVSQAEYQKLDKTVREFEPQAALLSGDQGYELIVRLLDQARPLLADRGFVIIEFSPMLAEQIDQFVTSDWEVASVRKDLAGLPRVLTLKKKSPDSSS